MLDYIQINFWFSDLDSKCKHNFDSIIFCFERTITCTYVHRIWIKNLVNIGNLIYPIKNQKNTLSSYLSYIKLGLSPGGSIFGKFQGGALFLSFIAFLCDNFKIFPNFSFSQRGDGGGTPVCPLCPHPNLTYVSSRIKKIIHGACSLHLHHHTQNFTYLQGLHQRSCWSSP